MGGMFYRREWTSMNSSPQLTLFDIGTLCEYAILISPNDTVTKDVLAQREKLSNYVVIPASSLRSVPHISLLKLKCRENDGYIVHTVHQALQDQHPFGITLHGADIFLHGKAAATLHIRIEEPYCIKRIHERLFHEFGLRERSFTPHLTIAKTVAAKYADKLKALLPMFSYYKEFICDRITILKKQIGADRRFHVLHQALLK